MGGPVVTSEVNSAPEVSPFLFCPGPLAPQSVSLFVALERRRRRGLCLIYALSAKERLHRINSLSDAPNTGCVESIPLPAKAEV